MWWCGQAGYRASTLDKAGGLPRPCGEGGAAAWALPCAPRAFLPGAPEQTTTQAVCSSVQERKPPSRAAELPLWSHSQCARPGLSKCGVVQGIRGTGLGRLVDILVSESLPVACPLRDYTGATKCLLGVTCVVGRHLLRGMAGGVREELRSGHCPVCPGDRARAALPAAALAAFFVCFETASH